MIRPQSCAIVDPLTVTLPLTWSTSTSAMPSKRLCCAVGHGYPAAGSFDSVGACAPRDDPPLLFFRSRQQSVARWFCEDSAAGTATGSTAEPQISSMNDLMAKHAPDLPAREDGRVLTVSDPDVPMGSPAAKILLIVETCRCRRPRRCRGACPVCWLPLPNLLRRQLTSMTFLVVREAAVQESHAVIFPARLLAARTVITCAGPFGLPPMLIFPHPSNVHRFAHSARHHRRIFRTHRPYHSRP